jgi:DNA-binding LacI/PurR family transcriptional regulator
MRTPGQRQIADLAGVSRSTVAWALSPQRRHRLRPETLQRVEQAIQQLGYRPHRYAQVMRRGKSGVIGMLRFAGSSPMRAELEHHALQQIRECGFKPMVLRSMLAPADVSATCEELLDAQIEGPNFSETQDVVGRFQRAGIPLVILSGSEVPHITHVRSDMKQGMSDLTRHLIRLGHTRLMLLLKWVDPQAYRYDWWRNYDKLAGFISAIREAGGSVRDRSGRLAELTRLNPEMTPVSGSSELFGEVEFETGEWNWFDPFREGMRATERVLRNGSRPSVLLCTNDDWAIGAMAACTRAGVRVPQDMAITGFDNFPVGEYLSVPLTTIAQPNQAKARTAVRMLSATIEGKSSSAPRVIKLPTQLVVRESCGQGLGR